MIKCEMCKYAEADKKCTVEDMRVCLECHNEAVNEARLEYGRINNAERFL